MILTNSRNGRRLDSCRSTGDCLHPCRRCSTGCSRSLRASEPARQSGHAASSRAALLSSCSVGVPPMHGFSARGGQWAVKYRPDAGN